MHILLRAIITGFGYKIGSELGRRFAEGLGLSETKQAKPDETFYPSGMNATDDEDEGGDPDEGDDDDKAPKPPTPDGSGAKFIGDASDWN